MKHVLNIFNICPINVVEFLKKVKRKANHFKMLTKKHGEI